MPAAYLPWKLVSPEARKRTQIPVCASRFHLRDKCCRWGCRDGQFAARIRYVDTTGKRVRKQVALNTKDPILARKKRVRAARGM